MAAKKARLLCCYQPTCLAGRVVVTAQYPDCLPDSVLQAGSAATEGQEGTVRDGSNPHGCMLIRSGGRPMVSQQHASVLAVRQATIPLLEAVRVNTSEST
jgi:hypothetical protein